MKHFLIALAGLWLGSTGLLAHADTRDDFPSCYQTLGKDAPQQGAPERELFVLIDETVDADERIQQSVIEKTLRFIRPGDALEVVRFAAFTGDHYSRLMLKGRIDERLSEDQRYSISKRALNSFDSCFQRQATYVKRQLGKAINDSFGDHPDIPKTELAGNLAAISTLVRNSEAEQKVVLLFSDMLENSDLTSFYQRGNVRTIDPDQELARLDRAGLESEWDGARVYIIGAGLIAQGNKAAYRSERTMDRLKTFWAGYFERGNAHLEGWGSPMLLEDLH
ncbi:hypothetical protein SAMN05421848_2379 [Kushneria avicenniae]|uniref:VWFA domain-containing protein n=1 Tax=Kushneria avicenniae TaxID=402385 RepID=A0A1I1LDA2_9GAMM|nr:hypothetical protein [Kushneria avicenniae]SFC71001.1 hypothetical protein SAMN05421848_2379 [Kushneria avicenniae]